jgi:adenylyltransferase/sulfurtransferase
MSLRDVDAMRFSRQLRLPEIGAAGHARLAATKALVVGCGGLGAPVIQYLAAAGVGHLTLVDDDTVDTSNLNRQVIHRERDVGRRKAERAAEWVKDLDARLETVALTDRVSPENARELVRRHDIVLDCADGMPIKYLLNDACVLESVALVHGAATGFSGTVLVVPAAGKPCVRCLFEEIPPPEWVESCQSAGVVGAVTGVVGSLMALEAIKVAAKAPITSAGTLLSLDLLSVSLASVPVVARAGCAACGSRPTVTARSEEDYLSTCKL